LDITVSKGKIGRLGVRKGDNVDKLVSTFSKSKEPFYISLHT